MVKPSVAALYVFDNVKRVGCIYNNAVEDKNGEFIHKVHLGHQRMLNCLLTIFRIEN